MFSDLKFFFQTSEGKVLALLLILGAAVRIYGAWSFRLNLNLDAGVVALMAKHISEGTAFPVFFYGQAHMGSLEAFFSALFMKVFSLYGFGATLGTAFVSFWVLPVVFLWARDIGGSRAGLAAVAFAVIGPLGFF
ncbi:hypothetical protein [Desulfonatronum thioautotrophicum]|uniref:hypothetical protein n=1 Tax=Desulfonatronum thioautotrophicum TaxID=617001 RepID=UPI0005EB2CF1|nr:hypothetical protein [Desulfonatronum thioautotrophicum]